MDRNLIRAAFFIRCGSHNRLFLRFTPFTVTKAYCNEIALRAMARLSVQKTVRAKQRVFDTEVTGNGYSQILCLRKHIYDPVPGRMCYNKDQDFLVLLAKRLCAFPVLRPDLPESGSVHGFRAMKRKE